jgi:hypothetical protein
MHRASALWLLCTVASGPCFISRALHLALWAVCMLAMWAGLLFLNALPSAVTLLAVTYLRAGPVSLDEYSGNAMCSAYRGALCSLN